MDIASVGNQTPVNRPTNEDGDTKVEKDGNPSRGATGTASQVTGDAQSSLVPPPASTGEAGSGENNILPLGQEQETGGQVNIKV